MASLPVRDPVADHLLTPQNSALVVIDYQPSQFAGVRSMDRDLLLDNIVSTVKTAKAFDLPIVHSTINVATGRGQPTVPELAQLLENTPPIDRTTTNAWEDAEFLAAVRATGRRKLILCALWTEICMAFPALDALREGYEVYPVVDAIGGTSEEAHRAGIERVVQAGAQPVTWVALAVELQRDWAREETVADVVEIVLTCAESRFDRWRPPCIGATSTWTSLAPADSETGEATDEQTAAAPVGRHPSPGRARHQRGCPDNAGGVQRTHGTGAGGSRCPAESG